MWGYTCRPISTKKSLRVCCNIPNARITFTVGKPQFLKALDSMNACFYWTPKACLDLYNYCMEKCCKYCLINLK